MDASAILGTFTGWLGAALAGTEGLHPCLCVGQAVLGGWAEIAAEELRRCVGRLQNLFANGLVLDDYG